MGTSQGKGLGSSKVLSAMEMADTMVNVPILTSLTEAQRAKLAQNLLRKTYKKGKSIIKQGDKPDGFYIIESGEAEVRKEEGKGSKSKKEYRAIATISAGDYFGERALIANTARVASVVAIQTTTCLFLAKKRFQELFSAEELAAKFAKRDAVCAEATQNLLLQRKPRQDELKKAPEQKKRILDALKDNIFFSQYDIEHLHRIVDAMFLQKLKEGDSPIKQGQMGDHVYVSESGNFRVTAKRDDGKIERTDNIGPGKVFGELALMYNSSRNATVTATEPSAVWVLDRFTFRRIVLNTSSERLKQYKDFLKRVPLLKSLSKIEREKVAEALDEKYFDKGQAIVKEGDIGDCMFIVRSGTARAQKKGETSSIEYQTGDYFGELALKDANANKRRQASVYAVTNCVLLKLSRVAVNLLLGPVEALIKKRMSRYSSNGSLPVIVPVEPLSPSESKEQSIQKLTMEDLKIIGRLGNGAFGLVRLVDYNGETYALKAVSKQKVVRSKQESHILNEKRVLMSVRHPFVTRLHATFQDDRCVYFMLEPCLGGELFTILRTKTSFNEKTSQFYAATVIEIFDYLQRRNIVYRDLKPENLLLDSRGFLKMTDFGFAKVIHGKTYTLCGTPDYLAPEIVVGKGHGKAVDWWTLGVLIYEMIAGYPPFYASKPMKTYAKILHAHVKYPTHFSNGAVDIIRRLLNRKPSERFGVTHGGPGLVRQHKWFKHFDFVSLMQEKLKPPIQPTVKSPKDIGNFRVGKRKDPEPPEYKGPDDWCKEF
mmetsp:Transcript_1439/g.2042  ORF Transcript_1439/g.2042 Transcript_1439/m.2042 type:complete len:768 (+) Transcript_1439:80-2383(+)|eukprot:CAMPEP_0167761922 /NCGR_PEP_ID=MMETSP0110_2-20121227/12452_1 /TAXON_ID=629695 /ORGANISM="Gymnochlora sp., Strain CCMP2014" /LENGTH=767 /DNA_ID=CAMNT_0007648681 /DNA_START=24 /DNA_END=2327 /DNA_ORIENTATION=+